MLEKPSDLKPAKSILSRLGLSREPGRAAPYLRAILAFIKEAPGVGWALKGTSEALKELADEEDDQVLEKHFERLFAVETRTLKSIEALAQIASITFSQQNALLAHLEQKGLLTDSKQLTGFAFEAALDAYRGRILAEYQYADHRGIEGATRAAHVASLPLDDVYVIPSLLPEQNQLNQSQRESEVLQALLDQQDLSFSKRNSLEEEYALLSGGQWQQSASAESQLYSLGTVLKGAQQAVIIGSPGTGKSTLVRYLARTCAFGLEAMHERLAWAEDISPIVIQLAAFADARSVRPDITLQDFLEEILIKRGGEALRAAMAEEMSNGRVFFFLDGVDEIPESHVRAAIVQAVDQFIVQHNLNRFLITSRPYGYIRLAGNITHLQLPNFTHKQVEEFISKWHKAFEIRQHPQAPDLERAKT